MDTINAKGFQWILQKNLTNQNTFSHIKSALADDGVLFQEVTTIPFSDALPSFEDSPVLSIFYGSTTLMLNAYSNPRYSKGVFYNDNFTITNYLDKWGSKMLNADAEVLSIEAFISKDLDPSSEWFVRPNADNKAFSGMTASREQLSEFHNRIKDSGNPHLNRHTLIAVSAPKRIDKEWRSFVGSESIDILSFRDQKILPNAAPTVMGKNLYTGEKTERGKTFSAGIGILGYSSEESKVTSAEGTVTNYSKKSYSILGVTADFTTGSNGSSTSQLSFQVGKKGSFLLGGEVGIKIPIITDQVIPKKRTL